MKSGKHPRDIICFGNDWYSPSRVSMRQIVEHYHRRGSRVLWINPVPIRFPDTKKKDFWNKVQSKARTHARFLSRDGERSYVYSPVYLPFYRGPGFWLNRLLVSFQVAALRVVLGIRRPLVFGSTFTAWFGLWGLAGAPLVFHFADKISSFREVSDQPRRRQRLEAMERALVDRAVVATCSSRSIFEHVRGLAAHVRCRVVYLPHAITADLFLEADGSPRSFPPPSELADIGGPVAGYFGSLTEANDKATFLAAARQLADWTFVFIGKTSGDYSELAALPNVRFLGPRPHAEIPVLGSRFDVCFMGWRAHEWIANCFPLKTLEYLALGKPIVCSSRIDELEERFPGFVVTTSDASGFANALVEAARSDSPDRAAARVAAVARETWDHRLEEIQRELAAGGADHE